jgi:hypothetical protein
MSRLNEKIDKYLMSESAEKEEFERVTKLIKASKTRAELDKASAEAHAFLNKYGKLKFNKVLKFLDSTDKDFMKSKYLNKFRELFADKNYTEYDPRYS